MVKATSLINQKKNEWKQMPVSVSATAGDSIFNENKILSSVPVSEILTENKHTKQKENRKEENNTNTKKKIMIGIGIGLAVIAAGLVIYDLRRPNSIIENFLKRRFLKIKLGKDIKDGIDFAKQAKSIPMEPIASPNENIVDTVIDKTIKDGGKILKDLGQDKHFSEKGLEYVGSRIADNPSIVSQIQGAESAPDAMKGMIELCGTGPTKAAQIISNDTGLMSKIKAKVPDLAEALAKTKSDCGFSRTFEEATAFLEQAFPGKGYVLERELSAGSIGATYLARKPDGTNVVIKMIKKGISVETLQQEQAFFESIIPKVASTAEESENMLQKIRELYKDWSGELDLFKSMQNNRMLASGATRFSVAPITEVAANGQCLVMDMAKGIQMNKLIEILKDYKINPGEFHIKYASLIKENPWLAEPEKVLEKLSPTVLKTFDEQFLFVKKGALNIMHSDPHTGNFFVTANKNGKLVLEFIDTDNCILRTSAEIKRDLQFISNYFVGNERKVAEYFVNMCNCNPVPKEQLTKMVAADIKKFIFGKKANITDLETFLNNIKIILKNHGLNISGDTTSLKAQIQYISVATEAAKLSGGNLNIFTIVKDIPKAIYSMMRSGINPFGCISDALKYATNNFKTALGASLQFIT